MPCSCKPRRVIIESPQENRERGGDDGLRTTCTTCGEWWPTPTEKQIEQRRIDDTKRRTKKWVESGSRRLYRRRRRDDDL